MTIKKVSVLIGIITVLGLTLLQLKPKSSYKTTIVEVNGQVIQVEKAQTTSQRALGLGQRDHLDPGNGMLFYFPNYGRPAIWMKNMRFALDIIWLKDNRVVDLAENVPVENGLNIPTYTPSEDANMVLEINAGEAKKFGIGKGTDIKIIDPS